MTMRPTDENTSRGLALDKTYPLSETQAPVAYVPGGHAHGKVVITI